MDTSKVFPVFWLPVYTHRDRNTTPDESLYRCRLL